jgi:poly(3-hydroxybutyrate) depolymerase
MTDKAESRTTKRLVALLLLLLLAAALAMLGIQLLTSERQPLPEALAAMASDGSVRVTQEPWLTFAPTEGTPQTGFIFYPGGRIDPQGYANLMKTIASEGYLVVVPDMPLNIAAFRPSIAQEIIAAHPEIDQWVIGGHSVGGAMAAQYTDRHSEDIAGLAIWASYPPDSADLSDLEVPVTLIYGSRETRVTDGSVAERQDLLPADTVYVRIEGGDHHQFGTYAIDPEDHLATISRESQQQQILEATLSLLGSVSNRTGD